MGPVNSTFPVHKVDYLSRACPTGAMRLSRFVKCSEFKECTDEEFALEKLCTRTNELPLLRIPAQSPEVLGHRILISRRNSIRLAGAGAAGRAVML
jgi:hypothetical protein